MTAFITSFLFVLLAEMFDKTQLLAMAFAARYGAVKVLVAVLFASFACNLMAVAIGHFLKSALPMDAVSLAAAVSFILFGLWMLKSDKLHGEERRKTRFGPVITVAIAFFLAEMGDKTQLAAISLSIQYGNAFAVLAGATLALVTAGAIGIMAGVIMRRYISEKMIKWFSAAVFIVYGMAGVYSALMNKG